jgi:hypothetical protein
MDRLPRMAYKILKSCNGHVRAVGDIAKEFGTDEHKISRYVRESLTPYISARPDGMDVNNTMIVTNAKGETYIEMHEQTLGDRKTQDMRWIITSIMAAVGIALGIINLLIK